MLMKELWIRNSYNLEPFRTSQQNVKLCNKNVCCNMSTPKEFLLLLSWLKCLQTSVVWHLHTALFQMDQTMLLNWKVKSIFLNWQKYGFSGSKHTLLLWYHKAVLFVYKMHLYSSIIYQLLIIFNNQQNQKVTPWPVLKCQMRTQIA